MNYNFIDETTDNVKTNQKTIRQCISCYNDFDHKQIAPELNAGYCFDCNVGRKRRCCALVKEQLDNGFKNMYRICYNRTINKGCIHHQSFNKKTDKQIMEYYLGIKNLIAENMKVCKGCNYIDIYGEFNPGKLITLIKCSQCNKRNKNKYFIGKIVDNDFLIKNKATKNYSDSGNNKILFYNVNIDGITLIIDSNDLKIIGVEKDYCDIRYT
jgi:hypothetical protein